MALRTVDKKWLGPKNTAERAQAGYWEWYAYLVHVDDGAWEGWYAEAMLGDPKKDGGQADAEICVGSVPYPDEASARAVYDQIVSPETGGAA